MFGDPSHMAVLRKNLENPAGERATGDGTTKEEALRGAIRQALTIEAGGQG
jgi:hypothetical protein